MRRMPFVCWISICVGLFISTHNGFGASLECQPWDLAKTYAAGEQILYNGSGYEAVRIVPQNTPPNPSDNGWFWKTITTCGVLPPTNLSYTGNPAIYTVGVAITPKTPAYGGGNPSSYQVNPALPSGLSIDTIAGIISGTPTVASTAANYVITAANSAGNALDTLNITVSPATAPPSNLAYSANPGNYMVGTAISPNTPTHGGGIPNAYGVSPTLPGGLTLNTSTGIITGTPSAVSPTANYVVTASNSAGSVSDTLAITVTSPVSPPTNLSYAWDTTIYTERKPIAPNAPTVTGTVTRYSVSPPFPSGLVLDSLTGIISGTPKAPAAAAEYTITASNAGGYATAKLRLEVKLAAPADLSYPQNPASYPVNVDANPNIPTLSGSATNYTVNPALPSGLVLDAASGMIWGRPSALAGMANYQVIASNSAGSDTVVLRIEIVSTAPIIASHSRRPTLRKGKAFRTVYSKSADRVQTELFDLQGRRFWMQHRPFTSPEKSNLP